MEITAKVVNNLYAVQVLDNTAVTGFIRCPVSSEEPSPDHCQRRECQYWSYCLYLFTPFVAFVHHDVRQENKAGEETVDETENMCEVVDIGEETQKEEDEDDGEKFHQGDARVLH